MAKKKRENSYEDYVTDPWRARFLVHVKTSEFIEKSFFFKDKGKAQACLDDFHENQIDKCLLEVTPVEYIQSIDKFKEKEG